MISENKSVLRKKNSEKKFPLLMNSVTKRSLSFSAFLLKLLSWSWGSIVLDNILLTKRALYLYMLVPFIVAEKVY